MRKTALLILVFLVALSNACAQSGFLKYYSGVGFARGHIQEIDGSRILSAVGAHQSGFSVMDDEGNILHSANYTVDTFLVLQSVRAMSTHEFLFVGGYFLDSCSANGLTTIPYMHPVLGRLDSLGTVVEVSHYVLNGPACSKVAGDLVLLESGDVLVHGTPSGGPSGNVFLFKVDGAGDVLWAKSFGSSGYEHLEFVKELPNGDLIFGMNRSTGGACLGRMDANGNFLWLKSYIRPNGVVRDVEVDNDSTFTVIGYTDSDWGSGTQLYTMRLNGAGDVQWCKGYASVSGWRPHAKIDMSAGGHYTVLGNIVVSGQGPGKAFLMSMDQNGDTLWTRVIGLTSNHYETWNLSTASDGGIYIAGQAWGLSPFLFKTDSLGHLPCQLDEYEHWHPVQVQDLFPTDSSFTLTAIDGAVRYPATVNDTIYPPVVTIDGCTITEVPSYTSRPPRPRVRPNPNTGRFTVDFTDPLQRDSYYSVFDATGRLLFQRPLAPGATKQDMDLSRFGRGTYVLRFTMPEGVSQERVVVE